MASALPKRDVSLSWPFCARPGCDARHTADWPCPPRGVWLVLSICPHCTPAHGGRYCQDHNATNWWLTKWRR